jgi:kinesin family protein 4/21/27
MFSISGYNVTILAYGQTGSGKTYSMGTTYAGDGDMGIIPRAINDIFYNIKEMEDWDFKITVSFMEVCMYVDINLYLILILQNLHK